jgi:serine phosphatase RsbU (regulator of sigma subunit)
MNEDFDLEKMERFYPLTKKAQELKLAIIHNYINHFTEDEKERQILYRNSFFYVLDEDTNELDYIEDLI